ncbi:5-methyltetrahydropteroyltriglutamate--homocysteine S-methyltransferase [Vibrio sp. ABG19]|uniref:5-methyltetrahydropteroyltriglutamate-- homocysteine S-methyltransferase n=1 Tax=Vibrio sp. ABG19 TaxID=2817385 RepID=UPI00249E0566|nr:5-methyltetrahydropteroyltriglutamate--homocysteine S-methyltransferase [Vibrio sp. ABG19]WGY48460.1 5-methyltetrahydropteroyltriglutamate--homocysteine S-methyltransferase [Vibrio sp. ABG19]
MSTVLPPFRADVVGSYLRPDYLHQARRDFASGTIDQAQLTAVEDRAITELVEKQQQAGLNVITDGEFRRSWWHLDFMWGLNGVEKAQIEQGYQFAAVETRAESTRLSGKISGHNHPFIEHFKFLLPLAAPGVTPRLTIPAPAQFLKELLRPCNKAHTESIYPDEAELLADIAAAYQTFIAELYAAGCRNLQLDDCTWGMLTDPKVAQASVKNDAACGCGHSHENGFEHQGAIQPLLNKLVKVNNAALLGAPQDLVLTTHVCRGNYRSTWAATGGYAPVADVLLGESAVSAFYLEFDTDRAGDFAPLAKLAPNKQVVLGLVSSKEGQLEPADAIVARIKEAAQYVPLENLCLSTQCGFASTEEGNALSEAQQWAKIALVKQVADEVWG